MRALATPPIAAGAASCGRARDQVATLYAHGHLHDVFRWASARLILCAVLWTEVAADVDGRLVAR